MRTLLELLEKVRPHCGEGDPAGGWCKRTAVYRVSWSDRSSCCCEEHLQQVRGWAATDNISDRTDDPYVEPVCESAVADEIDAALSSARPEAAATQEKR